MPTDLTAVLSDVVDRLVRSQHPEWLRVIDAARIDEPVQVDQVGLAAIEPYRWLIEAVGDGVTLTKAGYLPPGLVTRAMTELGWSDRWIGKHNREDMTPHVLELRLSAQRMGLLRKLKGRLLVTKTGGRLAGDPEGLWWHVTGRLLDVDAPGEQHASALYLLQVAADQPLDNVLLAEAMGILGWRSAAFDGLTPEQAFSVASAAYRALDLVNATPAYPRTGPPRPKPEAVRLARAMLLGRLATPELPAGALTSPGVQLKITLNDVEPPIWRRVVVPGGYSLLPLHTVIQTAMGWQNSHLHSYEIAGVLYSDQLAAEDPPQVPMGAESALSVEEISSLTTGFGYEYDFGDSWSHEILLEDADVGPVEVPRVTAGARACPPEDCGGISGYRDLLAALADPDQSDHAELLDWVGGGYDPEAFDLAGTDDRVATFGRVLNRMLRRAGTG